MTSANVYAWSKGSGAITVQDGSSWYSTGLIELGKTGYGTMLISGANSIFSTGGCAINRAKLIIADGGHLETRTFSASATYHAVDSNGTVRLDNGSADFAGRWNLNSGQVKRI